MPDPTPEAAQATTAAPVTEPVAPVNPTPDAAATTDATSPALAKAPRTPSRGQQSPAFPRPRGTAAALERARVALEAQEAATTAAAEPAKTEPAKPADPAAAEPAKVVDPVEPPKVEEPPKKDEPKPERISKGLASLADREAKLRVREQAIKTQLTELQTKQAQAAVDPDLVLVKSVKEALAKGGRGSALKVLGLVLRSAIEEMSREFVEPTPEDIARKVAQEELERHTKTLDEQQKANAAKTAEADQARVQVNRTEYTQKVGHEFVGAADEFPYLAANDVLDTDIMLFAAKVEAWTGKAPTPIEALRAYEKKLATAAEKAAAILAAKTKAAQPATVPPKAPLAAAVPPATPKPKTDEPAKPRSRPESQPIPEAMKPRRFVPAHERAKMAMDSLKIH